MSVLKTRNIIAGYSQHPVLNDISMDVGRGQFVGLLGPNGSGKTTLLRVISGILPPASGQVLLDGRDIAHLSRRQLARNIACLQQDAASDSSFTVREVAMMGRAPHLARLAWESADDIRIAEEAMQAADIGHLADRPINAISGGERQRALFAMCLAQHPRLLLLDEPVSHLDLGHQIQLLQRVRALSIDQGLTVIAVFHDLNLASEFCDRLLVLKDGKAQASGPPQEVITPKMIHDVYQASVLVETNRLSGKPHVVVTAVDRTSGTLPPCR